MVRQQLPYKVYTGEGEKLADCRFVEDAAAIVALGGQGMEIRYKRNTVWHEGAEEQPASESYDFVVKTVQHRIKTWNTIQYMAGKGLDDLQKALRE
jgi:hypothetical protein